MRLQNVLLIIVLVLLSGCSLGLPGQKSEATVAPPDAAPAAASPAKGQTALPPAKTAAVAAPAAPPVPLPQKTPFPGLGKPVAQAFDFNVWQIDDFTRQSYSVAGYFAVNYQNNVYAALLLAPLPELVDEANDEGMGQRFIIYRLTNGAATPTTADYEGDAFSIDPAGWRDVNGDGSPDLPVRLHKEVNYWDSDYWLLLSPDEEGALRNLLADFYTLNSAPVALQDLDNDLQPEVEVLVADWYNWGSLCPDCSPLGHKFY